MENMDNMQDFMANFEELTGQTPVTPVTPVAQPVDVATQAYSAPIVEAPNAVEYVSIQGTLYPVNKVVGIERRPVASYAEVKKSLRNEPEEEKARRRDHSEAFQWLGTVVDTINKEVKTDKKTGATYTVAKNATFLLWKVALLSTAGNPVYKTHEELLRYIAARCATDSLVLGKGDTALVLNISKRTPSDKNKGKEVNPVFTLKPVAFSSKYEITRLEEAKEYETDETGNRIPERNIKIDAEKLMAKYGITKEELTIDKAEQYPDFFHYKRKYKEKFKGLIPDKRRAKKAEKEQAQTTEINDFLRFYYGATEN